MKIKMNIDMGKFIKKIKFSSKEIKSNSQKVSKKRKGAIEFKSKENLEVKVVENVHNVDQNKRRRKKVGNEKELVENGEKKKNWKRKGSKKSLSEFFKNIFLNQRQIRFNYYALLFAMIVLCSGSFYLTSKSYKKYNEEDYQTYNTISAYNEDENVDLSEQKNVNEMTEEESNIIIKQKQEIISSMKQSQNTNGTTSKNTNTLNNTKKNNNVSVTKQIEKLEFVKPHEGQVQKLYAKDTLIYSKTLEMWKVHEGIDISGNVGDAVKASEKGDVIKIYDDSFLGKTVVIDHGQGYKTSYSNLGEKLYVNVGAKVKKNQKIGEIGTSSIGEIKDEPHLHFMLYKNDEIVDPSNIFYT